MIYEVFFRIKFYNWSKLIKKSYTNFSFILKTIQLNENIAYCYDIKLEHQKFSKYFKFSVFSHLNMSRKINFKIKCKNY